jgi:hypothetical protein
LNKQLTTLSDESNELKVQNKMLIKELDMFKKENDGRVTLTNS